MEGDVWVGMIDVEERRRGGVEGNVVMVEWEWVGVCMWVREERWLEDRVGGESDRGEEIGGIEGWVV